MRRHAFFIGLFVFVAAARFAILFASQTHVHSDEAIIGLMGKHILEGRHFPFYMYGQPYNAGAAWEAYLASRCVRVVRRRRRSVKRLHRSLIAAVSVSVLSDGLRPV